MSIGMFSPAKIGAITWGPTHDIWSAAIAISQIKFGLQGELAFQEVEQAIADEVTGNKNVWQVMDDKTRALDNDSSAVTRGFQKAASLPSEGIRRWPTNDGYIADWCEDLGYADFYNLAFRLFGFNAFSTHYLYFAILVLSVFAFFLSFWRDDLAVAVVTLVVTALFVLSSSSMFSEPIPSFAANRFLSTLGLIPLAHLVLSAFRIRSLPCTDIAMVTLQSLFLAFAVAVRSSAMWQVIALLGFIGALAGIRLFRANRDWATRREFVARFIRPRLGPAFVVALIVSAVVAASGLVRYSLMDERYFADDNMPHHLFWHSAWLGLTFNPEWSSYKPYSDLPDSVSDNAGFLFFVHRMKEEGASPVSLIHRPNSPAFYRARTYEKFIRRELVAFAIEHPRYIAKLYLYYKPWRFEQIISQLIESISRRVWLVSLGSLLLGAALVALSDEAHFGFAFPLVWLVSLTPVLWAYPKIYTICDSAWATILLLLTASVFTMAHFMRAAVKSMLAEQAIAG